MARVASVNVGAGPVLEGPVRDDPVGWVSQIQTKLHCWATADAGRRFDDLFNLVHDPATLVVAWERVARNRGARSAGSDGLTAARIAAEAGVPEFLNDLREQLRDGTFVPQPVRERKIPKPGGHGKTRRLGIPTVTDRVVQAALKLVLEPIFEADFEPVSYGFRPKRRAHDAIAEIHLFGTQRYWWVLDADIEACFDRIDHTALLGRVRRRVKDKRVLALVRAFLKAGLLSELGAFEDTHTGTPQGGILSPLLANIALSVLDEHLHVDWKPGGRMHTGPQRHGRTKRGKPNHRLIRYADDFVVMVNGTRADVQALHEEIAEVLAPMGLTLSPAKTRITHIDDGFEFLGFRIQRRKKQGANKWHVYTFVADQPFRSVKAKIRALTRRTSPGRPRRHADRDQPDQPWLGQLLPARRRLAHLQPPPPVHLVAARALATNPATLELEGHPTLAHHPHRQVAGDPRGRDRAIRPDNGADPSLPLSGGRDPLALADLDEDRLTAETVESRMR